MRTTIDLPADLMRAAKIQATQRGETLKALLTRALAHEVRMGAGQRSGARVALPLIGRDEAPRVDVRNADIEVALATEDAARYGG